MVRRGYVAILIQLMLWSGFYLAIWLAGNDFLLSKLLIFVVFLYLAYITAKKILNSNRISIFVTMASLSIFSLLQLSLFWLFR